MSKPLTFFLRLVLTAMLALALHSPHRLDAAQRSDDPRFGLVNAYEATQATYQSGASWEVVIVRWDQLQPTSPTQWNIPPQIVSGLAAARAASREVVVVLVGTPTWATDGNPGSGVPRGLSLPVNDPRNVWAAFVRQATDYFVAQGVDRLAIWRNPDIPPGARGAQWDGSITEYYQLVRVAYQVAKGVSPAVQIHLGGVGYDPAWFDRFLNVAIADSTAAANNYYFDVVTLHVYYSVDQLSTLMANAFYLMDRLGIPLKEVWVNETNARPAVDPDAYSEGQTFLRHQRVTLEQQAAFIVQAYAAGFAANRGAHIAIYRLVDDLEADNQEAFGLLRTDGSPRPAYQAYQLVVEQFSGFVYARHVEETQPLIDYVRLTFEHRVTHVAWARTAQTATLVIPARSEEATLIDLNGNRWHVTPQNGEYRVVVGGAVCNDPVDGCLIGGAPWLLVEEGLEDPLNETPPPVSVEEGGILPTPDPAFVMTATALVAPSPTPTVPTATPSATATMTMPAPTLTPTGTNPPESATQGPATPVETLPAATLVAAAGTASSEEVITPEAPGAVVEIDTSTLRPRGFLAAMPFILIGLGILAISVGVWYYVTESRDDRRRQHRAKPDSSAEQAEE